MAVSVWTESILCLYRNNHTPASLGIVVSSIVGLIHMGHYKRAAAVMTETISWDKTPQGHIFWYSMYKILATCDALRTKLNKDQLIEKLTGIVEDGIIYEATARTL